MINSRSYSYSYSVCMKFVLSCQWNEMKKKTKRKKNKTNHHESATTARKKNRLGEKPMLKALWSHKCRSWTLIVFFFSFFIIVVVGVFFCLSHRLLSMRVSCMRCMFLFDISISKYVWLSDFSISGLCLPMANGILWTLISATSFILLTNIPANSWCDFFLCVYAFFLRGEIAMRNSHLFRSAHHTTPKHSTPQHTTTYP